MRRPTILQLLAVGCFAAAAVVPLRADDCSSAGDCTYAPGNIDAATGLIAGGALLVLYNRWRRQRGTASPWDDGPCAELARQVQLGDETIRELERRAKDWKPPTPPPEGWKMPGTGHGPFLPAMTGGALKDFNPITGLPKSSATATVAPASSTAAAAPGGRVAAVLGWTPGGKRKVMVCKPIVGPDGQIRGYAMAEEEVDDSATSPGGPSAGPLQAGDSTDPNTIRLPGGRRLHVDPFEEWLTGTSTVAEALTRERADQARRLAALTGCREAAAPPVPAVARKPEKPVNVDDLAKELDEAMKRFEELQKQLKEEVGNSLNQLAKFNEDYNKAWNRGMDNLDDYLHTYLKLLPGLKKLFEAFVDRATALEMGHLIDEKIHQAIGAVMAVDGAAGLVRGIAKWGAEKAVLEAGEAGAEALAGKAAAGAVAKKAAGEGAEALGEGVAAKGLQKGAQKGALEAAESAVAKQGAEAAAAAPKPSPGAVPTGQAVETSKAAQAGMTQAESPAATLTGQQRTVAEAMADEKLKDILRPIRSTAGENQCTHATEAFAKTWDTGVQHQIAPTAAKEARTVAQMQDVFNSHYFPVSGDPASAMSKIKTMLETSGPGSQVLIKTTRLVDVGTDAAGVTSLDAMSHSFSAVNVDGFVKFVDVANPKLVLSAADVNTTFNWWVMFPK